MQRTILELSTAHLPEKEVNTLEVLIHDLEVIEEGMVGPLGIMLPVSLIESPLCPQVTYIVLSQIKARAVSGAEVQAETTHVLFTSVGQIDPGLAQFAWT